MAIAEYKSLSAVTVGTSELSIVSGTTTLATDTTDGVYQLFVDASNMAKLLASEASWLAANACLDAHGGFGFAADFDVERKFRETRLYSIAPVSNNLILAYLGEHVLDMPRSY